MNTTSGKLIIRALVVTRRFNHAAQPEIFTKRIVVHSMWCGQGDVPRIMDLFRVDNPGLAKLDLMATFETIDYV